MADEDQQQGTGTGRFYFAPSSSPDYVRVLEDVGPLPKSGRVVATPERVTEHTHESQDQDNGAAEVITEATVKEDEAHREKRKEILDRLADTRKSIASETDAEYADRMERTAKALAGAEAVVPLDGAMTRQEHLAMIDRDIAKYQNGHPVYTWKDNLKGVAMTPVRWAQGLWGLAQGAGNTVVDLGKGAAAGELMQSSDPELVAEGERLAKEAGDSLAARGKGAVEAIIFALPNMAKQASDGYWGESVGDAAGGWGASKAVSLAAGAVKGARRATNVAEDASGAGPVIGEPVSVTTGEYLETWHDFLIPGTFALKGDRYMGLKLPLPDGYESPLGACQISMFDEVFSNPDRGKLLFHDAAGKAIRFDRPFNFLPSKNSAHPHLELKAPWLKQLRLKDRGIVKHFRQYDDDVYRLEQVDDLNGNTLLFRRSENGWLERVDGPDGLSLIFDNDVQGRRLSITLIGIDGAELELARYVYDAAGRMTAADCAYGMSVRYLWLADRDLLSSWHNVSRQSETHFTYDDDDRVIHTRTNGIWNDDRFEYHEGETRYLPGGQESARLAFEYDGNKNVTAEIDALGGTVAHAYDRNSFRTSTTDQNGNARHTRYDIHGNVKESTDAEGRTTTYGWGDDGELLVVIDGAGNRTKYEHDNNANVISETDPEGHVTRLVRDSLGHVIETHFPNGAIERRTWDRYNRLESVTDAKGNTSRFEYDAFNRLIATTAPNGAISRQGYNAGTGGFDTVSEAIRPDGVRSSRSFDGAGQLATVTDGEGRVWSYRYGAFGVLEAIIDPKGGSLRLKTDIEGRLTSVTNAAGRVYSFERDAAGRVVLEEDFDGRVRRYTRDAAGHVAEMRKPDGASLRYAYDKSGLIKRIESFDAKGETEDVTRFWYDARALLTKAENKAALVEFQRDRNGRIISETLNGKRLKSRRDQMGNRIQREIVGAGGTLVDYVRDPLGLVAKMVAGDTEISFSRDSLGRETERRMGAFVVRQAFDAASQLIEQLAGTGEHGGLHRSRLGWNIAHAGSGDLHDLGSMHTRATEVRRSYEYDRAFAPVAIDDSLWGERRLTYDGNGQLTDAEANFGSERYRYDEARNLVGASSSISSTVENPTPYGKAFDETFGSIMPAGAPQAWNTTAGGVVRIARGPKGERIRLTHDECGRVVERRVDSDGSRPDRWRYLWDAHDRLVSVTTIDNQEWLFRYDPFGRRVSKVRRLSGEEKDRATRVWPELVGANGIPVGQRPHEFQDTDGDNRSPFVGTAYLWDRDHMVAEAPMRLDGHVAWDEAQHWYMEEGTHRLFAKRLNTGETFAVVCDHLGTPKEMFNKNGALVWAADHHIWGAVRSVRTTGASRKTSELQNPADDMQCPWRFPGQYADAETGLHYNRHRYYDPLIGQYSSPDPIGLAGGDRPQSYVPNPARWTDPLGLSVEYNYRGLHAGHPEIENARQGMIRPGDEHSNISPEEHNLGGVSSISPYTSWTDDIAVARRFADGQGPGGIVVKVPRGAPPAGAPWKWEFSFDEYMEREILLKGTRNDAIFVEDR